MKSQTFFAGLALAAILVLAAVALGDRHPGEVNDGQPLLLTLAEPADGRAGRHVVSQDLTQEELATMIGATRQAVSVALDRFEKGAMIERRGCRIAITDMAQLRRLCE